MGGKIFQPMFLSSIKKKSSLIFRLGKKLCVFLHYFFKPKNLAWDWVPLNPCCSLSYGKRFEAMFVWALKQTSTKIAVVKIADPNTTHTMIVLECAP